MDGSPARGLRTADPSRSTGPGTCSALTRPSREVDQLDTRRRRCDAAWSDHPGGARSAAVAAVTMVVADEPLLYGGAHEHGDPVPIPDGAANSPG